MKIKKTVFNLIFKCKLVSDYQMTLYTSEAKTDEEIEEIILNYIDMFNTAGYEDYTPVDIMDRICDAMQEEGRDWYWTDMEVTIIDDWS